MMCDWLRDLSMSDGLFAHWQRGVRRGQVWTTDAASERLHDTSQQTEHRHHRFGIVDHPPRHLKTKTLDLIEDHRWRRTVRYLASGFAHTESLVICDRASNVLYNQLREPPQTCSIEVLHSTQS